MDYDRAISSYVEQLTRLGYHAYTISQVIANFSGTTRPWPAMSPQQQRRLATDLRRYVGIARKWHYLTTGRLQ